MSRVWAARRLVKNVSMAKLGSEAKREPLLALACPEQQVSSMVGLSGYCMSTAAAQNLDALARAQKRHRAV